MYVEFPSCRMQFKVSNNRLLDKLSHYCLECILWDGNSTYKTGLNLIIWIQILFINFWKYIIFENKTECIYQRIYLL